MRNRIEPMAIATLSLLVTMASGCLPAVDGPTRADGKYNHDLTIGEIVLENFPAGGAGDEGADTSNSGDVDTGPEVAYDTGTGTSDDWCEQYCECLESMDTAFSYESCMADIAANPILVETCEAALQGCLGT